MKHEPQIIDYETSYLDMVEGHVSDHSYAEQRPQLPARQQSLVLPVRQENTQNTALSVALAQLLAQQGSNGDMDARAIQHMQMMSEKSSPKERSGAKLMQWAGIVAVCAVIAVAANKAGVDSSMAWGGFAICLGAWIYKINKDENAHSPAGVERHKSDTYAQIRLAEIKAGDKADERKHKTFGRVMDSVYGGNNANRRKDH